MSTTLESASTLLVVLQPCKIPYSCRWHVGARSVDLPGHIRDNLEESFNVNVLGVHWTTQAFLPLLKAAIDATVIMVSSGLGSLGWLSDPSNQFHGVNILGYNSSKTALNAVTVAFAKELAACGITVNAADPGYTATDFNGHSGYRTVEQAAAGIVWLATRTGRNMTGRFYFDQNEVPW